MSRQKTSSLLICLLLLFATACGQGQDDSLDGTSSATPSDTDDPAPLNGSVDLDGALTLERSDPYELQTDGEDAPFIENDTLALTVSYSGGCERHDFTLATDGSFMESDPVQLVVTLIHDANDDPCEAYPTDRYVFDLSPIKTLYQEAYRTDKGSIILNLRYGDYSDSKFLSLTYAFGL